MNQSPSKTAYCVLLERTGFTLIRGHEVIETQSGRWDYSSDPVSLAEQVAEILIKYGFNKNRLSLAIGSGLVLCVSMDNKSRSKAGTLYSMRFALEEHLPIDAEQMALCVIPQDKGQLVLIVDRGPLEAFVSQLGNEYGIQISRIVPATPIVLSYLIATRVVESSCRIVVIRDSDIELADLGGGSLANWQRFMSGELARVDLSERLALENKLRVGAGPGPLSVGGKIGAVNLVEQANPETLVSKNLPLYRIGSTAEGAAVGLFPGTELRSLAVNQSYEAWLAAAVNGPNTKDRDSEFDLDSQINSSSKLVSSISKASERLIVGLLLLSLCCAGMFAYRANQWSQVAETTDFELRQEYRKRFPGSRLNAPIESLLKSQLGKLQKENELVEYANQSARLLGNLERLLTAVPSDYRFDLIKVLPTGIRIEGEVKNLAELDALKERLTEHGFLVQPSAYSKKYSLSAIHNLDDTPSKEGKK